MSMVYDPKKVTIMFGPLPLLGFADGDMISVSRLGEGDQAAVGTAGEPVLIRSHDRRAEVTVRLMRVGAGRNTLAALQAYFNGVNAPLPLVINSIDTGESLAAGYATIKNEPELSFGSDHPVAEITFVAPKGMFTITKPDVEGLIPGMSIPGL